MGFLRPKVPTAPPPPNPAMAPLNPDPLINGDTGVYTSARSLINTGARGLKRRAETQRTSLIGG